jgi:hypothetical protein
MKLSKTNFLIGIVITVAIVIALVIILRTAMTTDKKTTIGNIFIYNIKEFSKTDPNLIKYKEISKIKTGLQNPYAITTDSSDHIYVTGDKSIKIFDAQGNVLSEIKLNDSPQCLTIAGDGSIYIGMKEHIEVYNPTGKLIKKWNSLGQNVVITAIAVSGDDVFIADAGRKIVLRYDVSGKPKATIGKRNPDKGIPGFVIPSPYFDLAVAPDGLLKVVNPGLHKIEAYTFDGDLESSWGETSIDIRGFSGCCNPVNIAILSDGNFVTCEKGIPRVKVYNSKGIFDSVVGGAESFADTVGIYNPVETKEDSTKALDVAVDSKDHILVLDPVEKTIRKWIKNIR